MTSIGDYFTQMLDNSLDWKGVEKINKEWGKQFAIKGIMSVEDAKKQLMWEQLPSWYPIMEADSSMVQDRLLIN